MNQVYIIAEAGVNHNGDLHLAKELVAKAAAAGANAVKFQTFKAENLVIESAKKADYQVKNTGNSDSQLAMLKKLELRKEDFKELARYCETQNIEFLSSPFDTESLSLLCGLGMTTIKIPSGEITNLPFLEAIGKTKQKVILSSGMSTLHEIEQAVDVLCKNGTRLQDLVVLHCNTDYPTPFEDVNLNAMQTIGDKLNVPIGYSDHTLGITIPIAAVAMGATVIEKHFTLDKNMEGPDHKASLDPDELAEMVQGIRVVEMAKGNGEKKPSPSEEKNILVVRKSIVARRDIAEGEIFSADNLTTKRPGNGTSPMHWHEYIGQKASKTYSKDEQI